MNATLRMLGLTPERVKAMIAANPGPPKPKKRRSHFGTIKRSPEEQARAIAMFRDGVSFRNVSAATGMSTGLLSKIKKGAGL